MALDIKRHLTASSGQAFWLIFGVLVFKIKSLDCLNHIYQTGIYKLLHPLALQTYALLLLDFRREQYGLLSFLIYISSTSYCCEAILDSGIC